MDELPRISRVPKLTRKLPSEFLEEILSSYRQVNPSSRAARFTEDAYRQLKQMLDRYPQLVARFLLGQDVEDDLYLLGKKLRQVSQNTVFSGDSIAIEVLSKWIDEVYNQIIPSK